MKKWLFLVFLTIGITVSAQTIAPPCKEVPALNKQILETLKPYIGKKIGRGECWDAAELALNTVQADWDGMYAYGRVIDISKECIQPGDILQMENVYLEVITDEGGYTESFPHHTAIVYSVKPNGELELIHQNTGQYGQRMGVTAFNIANKKKGTLTFYRPVAKK